MAIALELLELDDEGRWRHVRTERHYEPDTAVEAGEQWVGEDPDRRRYRLDEAV